MLPHPFSMASSRRHEEAFQVRHKLHLQQAKNGASWEKAGSLESASRTTD
jgi:hypothetical protein